MRKITLIDDGEDLFQNLAALDALADAGILPKDGLYSNEETEFFCSDEQAQVVADRMSEWKRLTGQNLEKLIIQ